MFFVLEKGFVSADNFGVFVQSLADTGAKPDEAFHSIGGHERVAEDLRGLLADTVHTARPLNETDDGPGKVVVHDDAGILKVLAFAQDIGRNQDPQFVWGRNLPPCLVGLRAESASKRGRIIRRTAHFRQSLDTPRGQLCSEVGHGVGELGEDQHFFAGVLFG